MSSKPTKTAIEPGILARVSAGVRYAISGKPTAGQAGVFFSPGATLAPQAQNESQGAVGRRYDFPIAINTQTRPRAQEAVSFADMRALADGYDLLRLVIETRKDQICAIPFGFRMKDKKAKADDARIQELAAFFHRPDKQHTWSQWLRMVLEDMIVIDAATVYPRLTRGGQLYSLEPIDGATIKRVIDSTGRAPMPPEPAYQQVLKGLPAVDYSADELLYMPRNPRTHKLYGYSPVEQIVAIVNIGIRRETAQLEHFTSGSVPESLLALPADWDSETIFKFQRHWDALLSGNSSERSKMRMVPNGSSYTPTKTEVLKGEFDEWIARIVCYAFSLDPSAFIKQTNKGTAGTAHQAAKEEGLLPSMNWVTELINDILMRYFGYTDIEFTFKTEEIVDPEAQARTFVAYVNAGVMEANEVREALGLEALDDERLAAMKPAPAGGFGFSGSADTEKLAKAFKPAITLQMPEIRMPEIVVDIAPVTIHVPRS